MTYLTPAAAATTSALCPKCRKAVLQQNPYSSSEYCPACRSVFLTGHQRFHEDPDFRSIIKITQCELETVEGPPVLCDRCEFLAHDDRSWWQRLISRFKHLFSK